MSKTIIIAGLHRSGTSYLSNCFVQAGIPIWHTSGGDHAECQRLLAINEQELGRQGLTFRDVSQDPQPNQDFIQELTEYKQLREGVGSPVYGFKDPRIASLIDAYLHVWPDALYILCVRNMLDAGRSWHDRKNVTTPLMGSIYLSWQFVDCARKMAEHDVDSVYFNYDNPDFGALEQAVMGHTGLDVDFATSWRGK